MQIRSTTSNQATRLLATFLTLSILAPLLSAGVAAASELCCAECPEPVSAAQAAPCHGSLFLSCCDDVATAPKADNQRCESRSLAVSGSVLRVVDSDNPSHVVPRHPAEVAWLTSALRRSVVIRT